MLKNDIIEQLKKSIGHLEYSFKKVTNIPLAKPLSEDNLETLESFSSRFARTSDIFVSKYFRLLVLEMDPAFRGSVIDLLNTAEKFGWIKDANSWRRIRELKNVAAHEYQIKDYLKLYQEIINLTPTVLDVSLSL